MSKKVAYVTGGMGGIGTADLPAAAQGGLQGHRRLRPEPRLREVAGRAEGAGLHLPRLGRQRRRLGLHRRGLQPRPRPSTARSTCWSTTPASRATACSCKMTPRRLGRGDRAPTSNSLFNVTKQVVDEHGRAGLGPHHQHHVGERREGPVRPDQLLGRQGRHARLHDGAGAGSGHQGRDGQHREPGLHRHRHGQGDPPGRAGQDRRHHPGQAPGHAGGDRLDRGLAGLRRIRASPPAPTSRSTAACTWGEACSAHGKAGESPPSRVLGLDARQGFMLPSTAARLSSAAQPVRTSRRWLRVGGPGGPGSSRTAGLPARAMHRTVARDRPCRAETVSGVGPSEVRPLAACAPRATQAVETPPRPLPWEYIGPASHHRRSGFHTRFTISNLLVQEVRQDWGCKLPPAGSRTAWARMPVTCGAW